MASIISQGSASGTGSMTLIAPNTNSNQTLTLPDNTGTAVTTGSTGVITAPMLNGAQTGSAPIYGCRAWCLFNGTLTGTNAPTNGGNVSNVVRTGVGLYTINFATALPTANFAIVVGGIQTTGNSALIVAKNNSGGANTTLSCSVSLTQAGVLLDSSPIPVAIFC